MKKTVFIISALLMTMSLNAGDRVKVWPKGKMPHCQEHQIAAMTDEADKEGFNPDKHRTAYIEWYDAPAKYVDND